MQIIFFKVYKHYQIIIISAFASRTSPGGILDMNSNAKLTPLRWITLERGIKCNLGTIWGYTNSRKETTFKIHFLFDLFGNAHHLPCI